ncbi:helix-turn-helix domain-containing protein [Comamonas faecalis]
MRARSELMMHLAEAIRAQSPTQAQAAELFDVTQPRVSGLMRGKVNLFPLDTHDRHGSHRGYGANGEGHHAPGCAPARVPWYA